MAEVIAEYVWNPTGWRRSLARLIGARPWGILRTPPDRPDVPYGAAVNFVVDWDNSAELKALASRPATQAEMRDAFHVLQRHGYRPWFERRNPDWSHKKYCHPNQPEKEHRMTTTLNVPPHGADGKFDKALGRASVEHMVKQVESGAETIIGVHRVDLADGTHQTIIHHRAA